MPKKIGVIAEDKSDVDVFISIFEKYLPKNSFSVKSFVGNGCGKIRQKCDSWAKLLIDRGCEHVIVVHDRDRNPEEDIKSSISKKLQKNIFKNTVIIIPVEELEAWLLSDCNAIKIAFSLPKVPKSIANCEEIPSPKEHMRDLVWQIGRKRYLNTVHNKKISVHTSLHSLRKCKSYQPLDQYITEKIQNGVGGI